MLLVGRIGNLNAYSFIDLVFYVGRKLRSTGRQKNGETVEPTFWFISGMIPKYNQVYITFLYYQVLKINKLTLSDPVFYDTCFH
jgi:hypothetical protein